MTQVAHNKWKTLERITAQVQVLETLQSPEVVWQAFYRVLLSDELSKPAQLVELRGELSKSVIGKV